MSESKIKRPSLYLYFTEVFRAIGDFTRLTTYYRSHKKETKGDRHPVLVIPGFLASHTSTVRLRHFINKLGYQAYDWELGRNLGKIEQLDILAKRIKELEQRHQQKVTLIGWSLGGVYARQLAKANPDSIRQLITMGAPFAGLMEPNNANWLFRLLNKGKKTEELKSKWLDEIIKPAPVPTTAIYSKEDGIVSWRVCMEPVVDATHQNIQVKGSHVGLGINAEVWKIVEDRLQHNAENWVLYRGGVSEL